MEKSQQFSALVKADVARKQYDQDVSKPNPFYEKGVEKRPRQVGRQVAPMQTMMLGLDQIKSYQPTYDPQHAESIARQAPSRLPPVEVFESEGQHWLVDGNHRAVGAHLRGDSAVLANVRYFG